VCATATSFTAPVVGTATLLRLAPFKLTPVATRSGLAAWTVIALDAREEGA
jgi:hypothetical protein